MFTFGLTINEVALKSFKSEISHELSAVKSSHRCEVIARGLGFRTYASARAAVANNISIVAKLDGEAFSTYLKAHGFEVSSRSFYRCGAKIALANISEYYPALTIWGIGIGRPQKGDDGKRESVAAFNARFEEARSELVSNYAVEPFLLSLAFLEQVAATKTIRKGAGSYWLKHIAENFAYSFPDGEKFGPHYVPNGAFIAAAIHAGFIFKTNVDDFGYPAVNVHFNMSKARLVDLDCQIRPNGAYADERRRRQLMRDEKNSELAAYRQFRNRLSNNQLSAA